MRDDSHVNQNDDANVRLLKLAVERGLLTHGQLETLVDRRDTANLCDLAVQEELIGSADIDLLKPLAEAKTFLPGYEFLEIVGVGATGAVYRARHEKLQRNVALKLLKPSVMQNDSATARSRIEARIGASLQHPNVVVVHDYGVHQQRIFLAQEFIQGESVDELIERDGPIPPKRALGLTEQVVRALSHAAESGVVHRDIKPANLLLAESDATLQSDDLPVVKVSDFGLAFQRMEGDNETRLTVDGSTLGTPSYAAPEQLINSNVDLRADIYSLGATLLHMVSGQQPFANANAFQAIADKMAGKETWREIEGLELPTALRQLIMDMTHHEIDDRIQTYPEVNERIQLLLQDQTALSKVEPAPAKTLGDVHKKKSRQKPIVVGLFASILMVASAWVALTPQHPIEASYTRSGPVISYYRVGDGVPPSAEHPHSGTWGIETDAELIDVIVGGANSTKVFRIPEFDPESKTYRFQIRINVLSDAAAASVCFAMNSDAKRYQFHSINLSNQEATFGSGSFRNGKVQTEKLGADASVVSDRKSPRIKLRPSTEAPSYQVVTIDRQPNGWFASVNGDSIGSCFVPPNETQEVAIHISMGTAHLVDIQAFATEPEAELEASETR